MSVAAASGATPLRERGPELLRSVLVLDAAVTGVNGLAYLALAGPLGELFDVEEALLRGVGAFLLAFAAGVAVVAARRPIVPVAAWTVVVANVGWVALSLLALAAGWLSPSTPGGVWVVLQALVVGAFAGLGASGLRRAVASRR